MNDPLWYKDAVFYQVSVRAFADGNGDGHGDFPGLTAKLDYFCDLGVDVLWLMPFYPSPLRDDGYDIADYRGVHPDYGTLDDFKTFLTQAHARGLRVIADLVLNHTSNAHPWFRSARADRSSPFRDYYVWSDTQDRYADARIIFLDVESSNWAWDPLAGQYYWHRFYAAQPDLNYDHPAVRAEMLDVVKFWLDLGLDGFRVDAVPYLYEREGTSCENLPETHAFLRSLRRFVDEGSRGRLLLAEANQWPADLRAYFGDGDPSAAGQAEFHMAFHFPIMPRIFMAIAQGDRGPIVDVLSATPPIPEGCQWCTFLRNHDELTLEMVTPEEREWMWQTYAPDPRMRQNLGIRRRLAPLLDGDRRKIELAHSLLFTLPGSPILYYGDEIGMGDDLRLPDRNGLRTPMQWDASPNAGFSEAEPARLYSPVIGDDRFGYRRVNVAAERRKPDTLWRRLREMIAVRRRHRAFGRGTSEFLALPDPAAFGVVRRHGTETVLALHNLSGAARSFPVDLAPWKRSKVRELLTAGATRAWRHGTVELGPFGYAWFELGR